MSMTTYDTSNVEQYISELENDTISGHRWILTINKGIKTTVYDFETEEDACKAQREHRKANGFDEITGEKI